VTVPVPVRLTFTGDGEPLEGICTLAAVPPGTVGAKLTPSWQSSPGESVRFEQLSKTMPN
jgi:hypothetical protein